MPKKRTNDRSQGSAPDAIFSLPLVGLQIALVEVSGVPSTTDQAHLSETDSNSQRVLKSVLKRISRKIPSGKAEMLLEIKLYDVQF